MGAKTAPNRKKAPQMKRKSAKDNQKEKGSKEVQEESTVHVQTVQREDAVHVHTVQQETDIHTDAQPAEKKRRCTVNPPQISTMDEALTMIKQRDPIDYGPGFSQVSLVSEKQKGQNAKNSPNGGRKGGIENHKSPQIEPVCAGNQGLIANDLTDDFKLIQTTCLKTHSDPGTYSLMLNHNPERKYPEEDFRTGVVKAPSKVETSWCNQ